jgi:hypothetical protein
MERSIRLVVGHCLSIIAFSIIFSPLCNAENPAMDKLASFVTSRAAWQERADTVRKNILSGAHLSPLPTRTPLHPQFANRRVRRSYTVEDVAFEATPGFYVFGNLYRPLHHVGKVPAILVAHGHFKEHGWYARTRPENQILCANLAAMGAVVFTYDMVGWGDSRQLPHNVNNVLQLQLWDSIRAVDFVTSLPEVDSHRIGITGASGGATQTILLAAVDPRVKASMPVSMVSSGFSGNDPCEDGMDIRSIPGLPPTNNSEIAALIAPHPLMIVSNGSDWTKNFPVEDLPYIQQVYQLFGSPENVQSLHFPDGKHDYGLTYREAAYRFFAHAFTLSPPHAAESALIESQQDQAVSKWIHVAATFPVENEESSGGFLSRTWDELVHVFSLLTMLLHD